MDVDIFGDNNGGGPDGSDGGNGDGKISGDALGVLSDDAVDKTDAGVDGVVRVSFCGDGFDALIADSFFPVSLLLLLLLLLLFLFEAIPQSFIRRI